MAGLGEAGLEVLGITGETALGLLDTRVEFFEEGIHVDTGVFHATAVLLDGYFTGRTVVGKERGVGVGHHDVQGIVDVHAGVVPVDTGG